MARGFVGLDRAKRSSIARGRQRDRNGRFAEEPDKAKPASRRRKKATEAVKTSGRKQIPKSALEAAKRLLEEAPGWTGVSNTKKLQDAAKALESLAPKMSEAQRSRLRKAILRSRKPTENPDTFKATLDRILPEAKKVTKATNVTWHDKGLEIWQNNEKQKKADPTFKVRVDKHYNYEVEVDGKKVSLNRNRNVFEFQGEVVKGVPSLHPHLRGMENKDLFKSLVSTMSMAESSKPKAPIWDPGLHGQTQGVDKWTYRTAKGKEEGYYGVMQVHHVGQWARRDFRQFNEDVASGKIPKDEAKRIYDEISFTETYKDKSETVTRRVIRPQEPGQREFVMLASGVHDANSSLFRANHSPYLINPDTGKLEQIGIPHKGLDAATGSRDWFDRRWKPKFWKEVYRRESYVLRQEINRRVQNGSMSLDDAKKLWQEVYNEAKS